MTAEDAADWEELVHAIVNCEEYVGATHTESSTGWSVRTMVAPTPIASHTALQQHTSYTLVVNHSLATIGC
jgi:hypothetical protein